MNQEDSEQNEVDGMKKVADSTDKLDVGLYEKEQLVICNDVNAYGRAWEG